MARKEIREKKNKNKNTAKVNTIRKKIPAFHLLSMNSLSFLAIFSYDTYNQKGTPVRSETLRKYFYSKCNAGYLQS